MYVRLTSISPPLGVISLMDEQPPKVTGGYANWSVVNRPRRVGLPTYAGADPIRLSFGIIIDAWALGLSVDALVSQVEQMAQVAPGSTQPPVLRAEGPLPHTDLPYVIESLEWEDVMRDKDGTMLRWSANIGLLQYVAEDRIQLSTPTRHRQKSGVTVVEVWRAKHNPYTVKKGDTISGIAKRELHDAKRWHEIAKLNKLRDPRHLKVGQRLRMP